MSGLDGDDLVKLILQFVSFVRGADGVEQT
jgi:hypothetical protein